MNGVGKKVEVLQAEKITLNRWSSLIRIMISFQISIKNDKFFLNCFSWKTWFFIILFGYKHFGVTFEDLKFILFYTECFFFQLKFFLEVEYWMMGNKMQKSRVKKNICIAKLIIFCQIYVHTWRFHLKEVTMDMTLNDERWLKTKKLSICSWPALFRFWPSTTP